MATENKSNASIVIAIIAIVVSVGSAFIQWQSLQAMEKQFEAEGEVLELEPFVQIYRTAGEETNWEAMNRGKVVEYEDSLSPNSPYVRIEVTNSGRSPGSIRAVGIKTGDPHEAVALGTGLLCSEPDNERLVDCQMPLALAPSAEEVVYLPLRELLDQVTCNEYIRGNGIEVYLEGLNAEYVASTGVGIAQAATCDELPDKPQDAS